MLLCEADSHLIHGTFNTKVNNAFKTKNVNEIVCIATATFGSQFCVLVMALVISGVLSYVESS